MTGPCNHEWWSIRGWTARYKCIICKAVGYRGMLVSEVTRVPEGRVIPYKCSKCGSPANFKRKRAWYCWKCKL